MKIELGAWYPKWTHVADLARGDGAGADKRYEEEVIMNGKVHRPVLAFTWFLVLFFTMVAPALSAFPEKPINFICSWPAGGSSDTVSRAITEAARKYFPQPMAVINRAGGAGTIGTAEIISAKPDGYTIGQSAVAPLTIQPHRTKLPYYLPEDYTPIVKLVNIPLVLAVKSDSPWKTIQDFLEYGKVHPGKLRITNPGMGSVYHLNVEQLRVMSKVDLTSVPLSGQAEQITVLLGGHAESAALTSGDVLQHVKAGTVRVLAVFEEKRNSLFPESPTFKEIGYDITMGVYIVVVGPKGLPAEVLRTLDEGFKKAIQDPLFTKPMQANGFDPSYENSEDLKRRLLRDFENNRKLLESIGKGK